MRIRLEDASLLSDLCDYLSLQGYVAVEASEDEADVLMPAPTDLEAATKLMVEINIWRAKQGAVEVSVNPE
jgi:uncharacterized protein (DUF2141 family)